MICNNKVYAGKNKLDLTKDTVYKHPSTKQCNYSIDTSNFVTKTELNKVKGMIDVSARVIGSKSVYSHSGGSVSADVIIGYDYIEIYVAYTPVGNNAIAVATTTPIIIANGGTGIISMDTNANNEKTYTYVEISCTSTTIDFVRASYADPVFACTIVFYKYNS